MPPAQARYWLLTIPENAWSPPEQLPEPISYVRGQLEQGGSTGYRHWQILVTFKRAVRLRAVKSAFCTEAHAEPSRSAAADEYVWKDDTAVVDTRFELGQKPIKRNSKTDWALVWNAASAGDFGRVPEDIRVRYYHALRAIRADHSKPPALERVVSVFWGKSRTGKSRRAWEEAGLDAYAKDPLCKFWDGYGGERHVIIDEFRGTIHISHLLRWLDRYPIRVQIKGSSVPLMATHFWITSNISPSEWYPDLDEDTKKALMKRLTTVIHFDGLQ